LALSGGAASFCFSAVTNEPALPAVGPHSGRCEFPLLADYRGIVEGAVFDRLGRPSFFAEAVEMVMGRIAGRIAEKNLEATAKRHGICAFAPQESGIRELAREEAFRLAAGN
jgi:hypothetical protein